PHLFDVFSQEDHSAVSKYGSTGLGMPITKSIVELMDGHIEVESEKGKGTTFKVTITLGESSHSSETGSELDGNSDGAHGGSDGQPGARVTDLEGKHILLAEDVEVNAEIMKMLLTKRGITVDIAENGVIAVDKFADNEPGFYDAILMDMRMPEMTGLEATAAIRAMEREDSKTIPIIALTANAFEEDVKRSMQAGLNAHLSKPVEPDILFATLEKLI
ncbi:MAG: response regulator, partial [Firmicutes bacterium]|nr:response regulator [Bacillota bacterium]